MSDIRITIDDLEIVAQPDQTILEAALANGIDIPNLCYDSRIIPTGACRLCLVEVQGGRGLQTSCTTRIKDGMIVRSETDQIRDMRRTLLELLLSEHRLSCTTCDQNGDCKLQQYAYRYQVDEKAFGLADLGRPGQNYTSESDAIKYDPSKCIRCGRCVRICDEVQMASALTFCSRAAQVEVTTGFDVPLLQSTCELCGNCISTCPTGALYERQAKGRGQIKDLVKTRSTCAYCGVGCQIDLNVNPKTGRIVRITSEPGVVPNNGNLCVKGRFGFEFVADPSRLTTPLIKRDGELHPATWDEAIDLIVDRLADIKARFGPDAIAGLSSAKCTNEENYVFQKFMRACIGTNNVDHCARLCHASTVTGLARAFGSGAMTNSIEEVKHAACIFVIGSNTTEAHPIIGLNIKEAVARNGAQLIVADPREIDLVRFAKVHLRHRPGSDVALINGLMNVIISEGIYDKAYIEERCAGFAEMAEIVKKYPPEVVAPITGVPAEKIVEAARIYANAETASIIYSMGITQHTTGTDNVLSLANLAMLTGNVGKPSTGVNPLRGQNNVQGACDLGALPNVYPGYQSVDDPELQAKFEKAWGAKLSPTKGLTIIEIMHEIEKGNVKALYVMGENPALSDPNLNRTRKSLDEVDFLVVQDIFLTETAQYADVVLPSFCFAEKDGTFTNTERRIQRVRRAVKEPGQARDDWATLCTISTRLGYPMHYDHPSEIMDEIASVTPIYGGISFDRIDKGGLAWPCPDKNHPGTPYLHKGTFKRGQGKFHPVEFHEPDEMPDDRYPLILSTGRLLYQFHTGTMSRKSKPIDQVSPTGFVEINPEDAEKLGIHNGDLVQVFTRRGKVRTTARVTAETAKGRIFMPFHFKEGPANMLTNDALDPIAKIPEFKVCAAAVCKAEVAGT